jgi:hypothetical protein
MKSAKRMVLIPVDLLSKFEQKQKLETPPIVSNMIQKDVEMSKVLYRDDLNDDVIEKLYHANLERYLNLKHQKDNTTPTVRLVSNSEIEDKEPVSPKENAQLSDSVIVESIPKTMQSRAVALLNRLKARPDVISWDQAGRVSLGGESIPHSNISDLISDAVRGRKNFNPAGSRQFFRALTKINMPRDLVRNENRWKEAQIDSPQGRDFVDSGPQVASPSKYFQTLVKRHKDARANSETEQTSKRWLNY